MSEQKTKILTGWITIIFASLIPVFLFLFLGDGKYGFNNFSSSVYSLGRICALAGITLFALTFVLSTRLKFLEEIFGGMDKVYLVHGITGGIAFMLILAHPILLVANLIPNSITKAASYFIPGGILSLNLGLIAILGFISLIVITFFVKMKYHHWKFTHEFMGAIFAVAVLHGLLVKSSVAIDNIFPGYIVFISLVTSIGLGAFFYSLVVRKKLIKYPFYIIKSIKTPGKEVWLELEPEEKPLSYESGQFVFARFHNENLTKEPHPFSISSDSNSRIIKLFIKKSGDFTYRLNHLKQGDKVSLEGAFGKFNFRNFRSKKQIWIAGGIGITPFLGMVEDLRHYKDYDIELFYTFRENYIVDKEMLDKINSIGNIKFIPWNSEKRGNLTVGKIIETSGEIKNKDILICGPTGLKESLIKELRKLGIRKDKIHEEIFELK